MKNKIVILLIICTCILSGCSRENTVVNFEEDSQAFSICIEDQLKETENTLSIILEDGDALTFNLFEDNQDILTKISELASSGYYDGLKIVKDKYNHKIQTYSSESIRANINIKRFPIKGALCINPENINELIIVTEDYDKDIARDIKEWPEELQDIYREYGGAPWMFTNYIIIGQIQGEIRDLEEEAKIIEKVLFF